MKKLVSILMILAMSTIDGHIQEKEEKEKQDGSSGQG